MSKSIAKKIVFARQKQINVFMSRLDSLIQKDTNHLSHVRYAVGVYLSNKALQKGFLKKVKEAYPAIGKDMTIEIMNRTVKHG